jgi:hypothetical protein
MPPLWTRSRRRAPSGSLSRRRPGAAAFPRRTVRSAVRERRGRNAFRVSALRSRTVGTQRMRRMERMLGQRRRQETTVREATSPQLTFSPTTHIFLGAPRETRRGGPQRAVVQSALCCFCSYSCCRGCSCSCSSIRSIRLIRLVPSVFDPSAETTNALPDPGVVLHRIEIDLDGAPRHYGAPFNAF